MSTHPRAALNTLVNALEEHLAAAANRRSEDDPSVESAYVAIANAFEDYEEALYDAYDEVTPLTVFADDDDDDSDDDDLDYDEDDDEDEDDEDLLEDNEMVDEDLVDEDDYDDDSAEDGPGGSASR